MNKLRGKFFFLKFGFSEEHLHLTRIVYILYRTQDLYNTIELHRRITNISTFLGGTFP